MNDLEPWRAQRAHGLHLTIGGSTEVDVVELLTAAGAREVMLGPGPREVIAIIGNENVEQAEDRIVSAWRGSVASAFYGLYIGSLAPLKSSRDVMHLGIPMHIAMAIDAGERWEMVVTDRPVAIVKSIMISFVGVSATVSP